MERPGDYPYGNRKVRKGSWLIREKNRVRLKISAPPLILLILLLIFSILFKIAGVTEVSQVMPLTIVFIGILVIAFGAFFDFGAKQYLQNLIMSKSKLKDETVININREQAIMTLIYVGIGILYMFSAVILVLLYRGI